MKIPDSAHDQKKNGTFLPASFAARTKELEWEHWVTDDGTDRPPLVRLDHG